MHDVLEDTHVGEDGLHGLFPIEVIRAVVVLTHDKRDPYVEYIRKVAADPIAQRVKLYDIADNITPARLPYTKNPAKYGDALLILAGRR
jgi:hypothetical protein